MLYLVLLDPWVVGKHPCDLLLRAPTTFRELLQLVRQFLEVKLRLTEDLREEQVQEKAKQKGWRIKTSAWYIRAATRQSVSSKTAQEMKKQSGKME